MGCEVNGEYLGVTTRHALGEKYCHSKTEREIETITSTFSNIHTNTLCSLLVGFVEPATRKFLERQSTLTL